MLIKGSKNLHVYLEDLFEKKFHEYFEDADLWKDDEILYYIDEEEIINQIKNKYISINDINGKETYYTTLE